MLRFDEVTHTYTLEGVNLKSVSSIVASQFRGFNSHIVSRAIAKSNKTNANSEYYGMNHDDIMKMWSDNGKEARQAGTNLHRQIEEYYKYGWEPSDGGSVEWKQFCEFRAVNPDWECLATEYQVHNDKVAGTIDAVFNTPEGIVLVDWKRTKAIDYSGYGLGRNHMKHVADCNYSKYSLQLSLYKQLCPFDVKDCYIVQLHPIQENYQKIKAQKFDIEARQLIS